MKYYLAGKIVEKCERSGNDWRAGVRGGRSLQIRQQEYDECGKSALVEEAKELEEAGLIRVKWVIRGSDVDRVFFRLEDLPAFYGIAGVVPKQQIITDYRTALTEQLNCIRTDWIRTYYEYLLDRLDQGKIPKELEKRELLFACMKGLDRLEGPVFKRVFSRQYLHGSKVFEQQLESLIVSAASRYYEEITEAMDKTAVLSQLFLEEYAQELAVKGALCLSVEDRELCLSDFPYGTVLNSRTMTHAKIRKPAPELKRVISIENKANFMAMPYRSDTLYVFSHGYFSPREREFLIQMREAFPEGQIQYFHSGDLDYGGIKIYEYIKCRIFPDLKPYKMDVETFEKYSEFAEPIEGQTLEKIRKTKVPDLQDLIEKIAETGMGIEQESFLVNSSFLS